MKKQNSNNFIVSLFGNRKISRVVLMAYILAPIFLFAVGFASWTIVTPELAGIFGNGSFVSNQLLDSTKYISLTDGYESFTATTTVGGFVTPEGAVTNKTTFTVEFDIQLGECQSLFDSESDGDLYFTFALCFADRTLSTLFDVNNFKTNVSIGEKEVTESGIEVSTTSMENTGVVATIKSFKADGATTFSTEAATGSTYVFVMQLHFPASTESGYKSIASDICAELTIEYTLTPQSAEHYRELMDIVFGADGKSKSLMSDVRITSYEPYTMQ